MLRIPSFDVDNVEYIVQQSDLEIVIVGRRCSKGRRCVDFEQPGFEVLVDKDVIAIHFEGVLVIDDNLLDGKQRANEDVLHLSKKLFCPFLAVFCIQILPQTAS